MNKKILFLLTYCFSCFSFGEVWVDQHGQAFIEIGSSSVEIKTTGYSYFFDRLLDDVRDGQKIYIFIGFDNEDGLATDPIIGDVRPLFEAQGRVRVIAFENIQSEFTLKAIEKYLNDGERIKVTITNFDIYAKYVIHKDHTLGDDARDILSE